MSVREARLGNFDTQKIAVSITYNKRVILVTCKDTQADDLRENLYASLNTSVSSSLVLCSQTAVDSGCIALH